VSAPSPLLAAVDRYWDERILPTLTDYIRIPNVSPAFDADWREHGHMDAAVTLARRWCEAEKPPRARVTVHRLEDRTPILLVDIPARGVSNEDTRTVLLYGHLDKQPPFTGWGEGLGPWTPVLRDGRLYGRGGADDGYAVFAALAAYRLLEANDLPHGRAVVLIECSEESGSPDLAAHVEALRPNLGRVDLVVCLDSGCLDYERLWLTTSLRGNLIAELRVAVLREGVHSGNAGGLLPSVTMVLRRLLDRIEDPRDGRVLLSALTVEVPDDRMRETERLAALVPAERLRKDFPLLEGVGLLHDDARELHLANTWRAALAVTGLDGFPSVRDGGNVHLPQARVKLSFRLPPTVDVDEAARALREVLEASPPSGARVNFLPLSGMPGWNAPSFAPYLERACEEASRAHFGASFQAMGMGGSIPFMNMLAASYPEAQYCVTGVLGPHSNAHGPNEFLDVPTAKRLTAIIHDIVAAHARTLSAEG
jgi:acetylornithine deacetylase/succinyl-diaminopimelate desuccinylase-like protein